jgi:hypothetical protein
MSSKHSKNNKNSKVTKSSLKRIDDLFVVIEPSHEKDNDKEYWDELNAILKDENGNYRKETMEALAYFFMNYDISNFDPRDIPKGCRLSDHGMIEF